MQYILNLLRSAKNNDIPNVLIGNVLIFGDGTLKRTIMEITWKRKNARVYYKVFYIW